MKQKAEIWNLTEVSEKHRLMRQVSSLLPGLYSVLIKPKRPTRTLDQNAYYWVAVVAPFREWLQENWGENATPEQAHDTLKLALLEMPKVEGILIMPRSRSLDKTEFSKYIERCIEFLATKCDIAVIPSDLFYEMKGKP